MTDEITQTEIIPLTAVESITRGEIDMQINTAKRFPRSLARFRKQALEMATVDVETAESCFYNLPRGDGIEGPSIRLAEIVATSYGNLRIAGRIVDTGEKEITAQGVVHDLETNVAYSVEVKRSILDKYGKRYKQDMVVVTGNAAVSIAVRNAIFKVVPRSYIDPIYNAAKKVAVGDATTLASRRQRVIDYFATLDVTTDQLLTLLERNGVEEITLDDLTKLTGLKTAIKDGSTTVPQMFPPKLAEIKSPGAFAKAGVAKETKPKADTKKTESEPSTDTKTSDPETPNTDELISQVNALGTELHGIEWATIGAKMAETASEGALREIRLLNEKELNSVLGKLEAAKGGAK
jgi:hypothetical protein